jgi:hypothetical protein
MKAVKYPRTKHLPWSDGVCCDDRVLDNILNFRNRKIVVTEKMDGENFSLYRDYCHARSIDSGHHISRSWVKNFWNGMRHHIPEGWRVCGENLYAKHSIYYGDLLSYFYGFSVWNDRNYCLSWDDTMEWFGLLGITSVKVLYIGDFEEKVLRDIVRNMDLDRNEGYVVRQFGAFSYNDFEKNVAKYVRPAHVKTDNHWMSERVIRNWLVEGP